MAHEEESVVPPFPTQEPKGERLYRVRFGQYIQYNGTGQKPDEITAYQDVYGEMPPYMPLPDEPVEFHVGDGYGKSRHVAWKGKGAIPIPVLSFIRDNGALPQYTREATIDIS